MEPQKYKQHLTPDQALDKLQKYCAYQDRCHQDVANKLFEYGVYGDDRDEIISELISDNFLNETRFAESYARGKHRIKAWSKAKITMELKRRNISSYNIKKALQQIDNQLYIDQIIKAISKKERTLDREKNRFIKHKKIKDYMLRKGYHYAEIAEFLPSV